MVVLQRDLAAANSAQHPSVVALAGALIWIDSPRMGELLARFKAAGWSAEGAQAGPKIAALLADAGIVRNRAKIASAIKNAQAFLESAGA